MFGKRSLGHEQKTQKQRRCRRPGTLFSPIKKEEGVKKSEIMVEREEAWKRIIAKYISSIRDALGTQDLLYTI